MKHIDLNEIKRLYSKGSSDSKIAKELGCSRKTISRRRAKIGLPPIPIEAITEEDL